MSHEKCSKKAIKPLKKELKVYQKNGIQLFMDGKPSTPKDIAKACFFVYVCGYMFFYTEDETGRIARVDFDLIREAPQKHIQVKRR